MHLKIKKIWPRFPTFSLRSFLRRRLLWLFQVGPQYRTASRAGQNGSSRPTGTAVWKIPATRTKLAHGIHRPRDGCGWPVKSPVDCLWITDWRTRHDPSKNPGPRSRLAAVVIGSAPFSHALPPKDPIQVRIWKNVMVPMRDGVRLATDVYLPNGETTPPGPFPAILIRHPYGKHRSSKTAEFFTTHGYAVAIQDTRGRYESEGEFYIYVNEGEDGYDAVEWIAAQPWSNRRRGDLRRIVWGRLPERPGGPESAPPEDHVRLRGHLQLHRGRRGPGRRLRPPAQHGLRIPLWPRPARRPNPPIRTRKKTRPRWRS